MLQLVIIASSYTKSQCHRLFYFAEAMTHVKLSLVYSRDETTQLTAMRLADPSGADFMRILAAETDCMAHPFPSTIRISRQRTRNMVLSSTRFITLKTKPSIVFERMITQLLVL
mgnify:CR=1 FL=1